MSVQVDHRANRIVVSCLGAIDSELGSVLLSTVQSLPAESELPVVLDLSAVSMIDNDGLVVLRLLFASAADRQAMAKPHAPLMLRLANVCAAVERTLNKSGFTERLAGWPDSALTGLDEYGDSSRLTRVRAAFPPPVSDPVQDAYFVQSVARAI